MSTALSTQTRNDYVALAENSDVGEIVRANLGEGEAFDVSLLTRVKVPSGGGTTWTIPTVEGDENAKVLEGAFLHWSKQGLLWPHEEPVEGDQPILVSYDLETAELRGPIPAELNDTLERFRLSDTTYDWRGLAADNGPFGYGTGKSGHGKRVKEQRLVVLLRKGDIMPTVVTVPPGSLKNFAKLMFGMTNFQLPYWKTAVRLTLEKATSRGGQPFAKIAFSVAGRLDPETADMLRRLYGSKLEAAARAMASDAEPSEDE